jgi:hypothetical protein
MAEEEVLKDLKEKGFKRNGKYIGKGIFKGEKGKKSFVVCLVKLLFLYPLSCYFIIFFNIYLFIL